jgi:pilus assembly protein CpaD
MAMSWSKPLNRIVVSSAKLKLVLCGAALVGLAACASTEPKTLATAAKLPTEHFSAQVTETPDQVALGVHAEGLSANQQAALTSFVGRWREAGGGVIVVQAPADAADANQARSMSYAVQSQLQALGVPSERIQLTAYNSGGGRAPVLASFQRLTAQGPDCSGGWDNLTSTNSNEPYKHFGCALTANMAVQIADPRDLVSPPGLAPADNTRRQVVLGKYREGKVTASDKDAQASGAVSTAVQQ